MNYGHFDADAREYVITRPDTPRAWSNYLGSRKYGGIITTGAGGYSFAHSPAEGRILRHRYNSVPMDLPGRQFYLRDAATGDFWSAAWQATAKPLDRYKTETRFGPGYATIISEYSGIRSESLYFVPLDAEHEVWRLRVTNTDATPRVLDVFSFCEFTTEWNLKNDLLNLQYTQYIGEARWRDGFIAASSCARLPEDPGNFANRDQSRHWWMTQSGGEILGHDCDREAFLGPYGGFHNPDAVVRGTCTNTDGISDNTCGAIQSRITLAPGESTEILVLLGIGRAGTRGKSVAASYTDSTRIDAELATLKTHWHSLFNMLTVHTPDAAFDHMVNTWGAYNALMTFEWSRSCSLVYTGDQRDGFGFRDTVQDCLGVTAMLPDLVRERLVLMLSAQDSSGGAQPEVRPWSHKPGHMAPTHPAEYRSDDCLWFFNAIPTYVAESGDTAFYQTMVPYADQGQATVLDHLRRAMEFNLERTGANGLPCGLLADWNDCLKLGYKGESIFVTFQLRLALKTYAEICAGQPDEKLWAESQLAALDKKIAAVCWDGEWFRWAIAEDGTVFGTKDYPEGQVYLNTQAWAILSGAASEVQSAKALQAVRDRLASDWGVALCAPPFEKTPVEVMRAVLFNPGNKENGGIFSHTQSWAVLAEVLAGDGDTAWKYYRSFLPSVQNDMADIREIEPYVHCQSTHSQFSEKAGRSRVPWLSGTASWAHFTATHHLLGIRPEPDGLRIDPCIPRDWPGFTATRQFRRMTLHIEVTNPDGKNRGIAKLTADGQSLEGNFIPASVLRDGIRIQAQLGG
ncbi:MAG: N,N'-diacetylchitobiose phosphorylase [Verrucomicrobia bacterium]|nr:N,N'-diacetylchitobiose phosphorylase [Verrucomicrobiota bacterium]